MDGLQRSDPEQVQTKQFSQEAEPIGASRFIIEWRVSPNSPATGESADEACCGCGGCGCLCNSG